MHSVEFLIIGVMGTFNEGVGMLLPEECSERHQGDRGYISA
jgi:hypothetical protein